MNPTEHRFQELIFPAPDAKAPEVLIWSEESSNRLNYVLKFIFRSVLLCNHRLTKSKEEFHSFRGPKLNYTSTSVPTALQIKPEGLLTENSLRQEKPTLYIKNNIVRCFVTGAPGNDKESEQDIFSLVFYFISRYEEWQEISRDEHGRFPGDKSILQEAGLGSFPIVDFAINELKEKIQIVFPDFDFPRRKAQLISTIDVDNLYAFREKPMWRQAGATLRDLIHGDFKQIYYRYKVLAGNRNDPFDIYDEVPEFCAKNQIPLILFFLYSSGTAYDRSFNSGATAFGKVFERLKQYPCRIGLHPSYYSSSEENLINREARKFSKDTGVEEIWSRQHFLRFDIRSVSERLLNAGLHLDFSMGWSDRAGFRAGTAFPFPYYDFHRENTRDLHFVPFCLMDGAYSIHHPQGSDHILHKALSMAEHIKTCGSYFISVYHERSFYNHLYPGFGPLYKELHISIKELFNS